VDVVAPAGIAWPPEEPRIRLQEMIDLASAARSGRAKVSRWLGEDSHGVAFRRPYGVAWEDQGLLVVDPDAHVLARIGAGGRLTFAPKNAFAQPIGVAACDRGIVVTDAVAGRVAVLGPDLKPTEWLAEDLVRPTGVACDAGRLAIAETGAHRILLLDREGNRELLGTRGTGPGQFNFPTSLAIDDGVLLVGDAMNFRIQRIDLATGAALGSFGALGDAPGEMPRLKGIAVDSRGQLWVADAHLDRVSLYGTGGELLLSIGGAGNRPAEFSFPAGIAAHPDGRVAVVDSLNNRLKIFRVLETGSSDGA
jgi:DNA-binding beta-propeller fold protein YncE